MGEQSSSFPEISVGSLGWRCSARGCVPWVGAGHLSVLQNDVFKSCWTRGCPEPPSLPGELSGTPLPSGTISFCQFARVFPLILFFHGAKSLLRAPPSLLGITTKSPIPSPCHLWGLRPPWGWHPHCHPVPAALRAPRVLPGLSCGTEINIKSWQSNEPKIQRQNKLLIARAGSARPGPVMGHLGVYVTP